MLLEGGDNCQRLVSHLEMAGLLRSKAGWMPSHVYINDNGVITLQLRPPAVRHHAFEQ
jgi:hypothetical protein